jgi:hypothetical protein
MTMDLLPQSLSEYFACDSSVEKRRFNFKPELTSANVAWLVLCDNKLHQIDRQPKQ